MTEKQNPVLTFDGKSYKINDLSDATKDLVAALQIAEGQLRFLEDNVRILSVGRQSLAVQLEQSLKSVTPIDVQ